MNTPFLRLALTADAVASLALGGLMIAAGGFVAGLTDLPPGLLFWAGAALLPWGAYILWAATRPAIPRLAVQIVIEVNLLWTIGSFALMAFGAIQPNALGIAFVAVQALAVLGLAIAQWAALRQPANAVA
ncbi:MAG: hypothetical protein QM698_13300 [Micropepsaceae bacterium]